MRHLALPLCLCTALLAGCDALGIESASQVAERKQAEAHAIGSACRHAVRSIEDCFQTNPKAGKAAVFAGWKEMDQYMRDNQIVGMPSAIESPTGEEVVEHEDTAPQEEHASGDAKSSTGKKATDKAPAAKSSSDTKTHKS
jgi:hypothetical protein